MENDHIDLVPNVYYDQAVHRPLLVVKKYSDGDALAAALMLGDAAARVL